jgi:Protein of unknown function (DUF3617)
MRKTRVWITSGCCLVALAIFAWAQPNRKPGLWEITSTMTWQQSPFPPGMQMPPAAAAAFGGGPRTTQVCLTQAWIDRYGAPIPQSRGNCQATNISLKPNSMTADWVCTGQMMGKGTLESSWDDTDHAKGKMHFVGTMQPGRAPNPIPIEFTVVSESVYKGAECGSVQPMQMPASQ